MMDKAAFAIIRHLAKTLLGWPGSAGEALLGSGGDGEALLVTGDCVRKHW